MSVKADGGLTGSLSYARGGKVVRHPPPSWPGLINWARPVVVAVFVDRPGGRALKSSDEICLASAMVVYMQAKLKGKDGLGNA